MKVLLTGGTGFLGKRVLSLLLEDSRIESVAVVSRRKTTHPNEKVSLLPVDLSDPAAVNGLPADVDAVIHLAGLYDFSQPMDANYRDNVVSTLNLVNWLRELNRVRPVPILFASTYAVGFGRIAPLVEKPLETLPSRRIPYAYTKAIAEQSITSSGIPASIFRLGILTGDSETGAIEKIDGPYYFMKLLHTLGRMGVGRLPLPFVPVPAKKNGVIPLVPVDTAAAVFHAALFVERGAKKRSEPRIYGVYDPESVVIGDFGSQMAKQFLPSARLMYFDKIPPRFLDYQEKLTGIPGAVFRFSIAGFPIENSRFVEEFPKHRIPRFDDYREVFIQGFAHFVGIKTGENS